MKVNGEADVSLKTLTNDRDRDVILLKEGLLSSFLIVLFT